MAGQTYNIDLQATDSTGSMKQRTKDAKEHNQELTKTQQLLKQQSGATSRTASAEYGIMRATGAGTGAAGRDFAKESQGLSGLVRLYAIYAANIFAASAAFRALSDAADTSNMIKGLDQLGSYSGVALGQLAKNLSKVSEGALSMRESMEAVAQASTAGLNPKQILDLGKVAKGAAQVLGRDMSDALSRLSRGVVKLEPELLDELGLFTKIGPATEKYALSIGKTAGQLTDFERRQAFANAVIKEGLDKFQEIKIDVNPYQKLLGTLKDLSFGALEFLNGALKPLVSLLASNPNALAAILAGIGTMMIKSAIPAVGQYRKSLQDLTVESAKQAQIKVQGTRDALAQEVALRKQAADNAAQAEFNKYEQSSDRLTALKNKASLKLKGSSKEGYEISQKDIHNITNEDLAKLDALGAKNTKVSGTYRDLAQNVRDYRIAEEKYNKVAAEGEASLKAKAHWLTTAGQLEIDTQNKLQQSRNQELVSQANYTGSTRGATAAIKDLWAEIKKGRSGDTTRIFDELNDKGEKTGVTITSTVKKMSLFSAATNLVKGSFMAMTGAIGTALAVAAPWLEIIGLIIAAIGIMDGKFDSAKVQVSDFKDSLSSLNSAGKLYTDVIDTMFRKDASQVFSTQSIDAQAKAMQNLNDMWVDFNAKFDKAQQAVSESWWSRTRDRFFSFFGSGLKDDFQSGLKDNLSLAIKAVNRGTMDKSLLVDFGKILNVTDPVNNINALEKALEGLEPGSHKVKELGDALLKASNKSKIAADAQTSFKDALTKSNTSVQEFMKQYTINDPLSKMLLEQADALTKLEDALNKPIAESLGTLVEVINNINANPLFGQDQMDQLRIFKTEINSVNQQLGSLAKAKDTYGQEKLKLETANKNIVLADQTKSDLTANPNDSRYQGNLAKEFAQNINAINQTNFALGKAIDAEERLQGDAVKVATQMQKFVPESMQAVSASMAKKIGAELAKGSTQFLQGIYAKLDVVPELAQKAYDLKVKEIDNQLALIKTNRDLIVAMLQNPLEDKKYNAGIKIKDLELQALDPALRQGQIDTIKAQIEFYKNVQTSAEKAINLVQLAKTDPAGAVTQAGVKDNGMSAADKNSAISAAMSITGNIAAGNLLIQEKKTVLSEKELKFISDTYKVEEERNARTLQDLNIRESTLESLKATGKASYDYYNTEKSSITIDRAKQEYSNSILANSKELVTQYALAGQLDKEKKGADATKVRDAADLVYAAKDKLATDTKNQKINADGDATTNRLAVDRFNIRMKEKEVSLEIRNIQYGSNTERVGFDKEILSNLLAQGKITQDEFDIQTRSLALKLIELDTTNKIDNIETKRNLDKDKAIETARQSGTVSQAALTAELAAIDSKANAEVAASERTKRGRQEVEASLVQLNERGKGYLDIYNGFVNSFTDGLVEFAKTGKFAFKDMVSSMIMDLVKLEIRLKMTQMMQAVGGFTGFITNVLGISNATLPASSPGYTFSQPPPIDYSLTSRKALGAMYDQGMEKYANGGVFANSIVTSPTLFKFAHGAKMGMMGEAGPEAIVPLKRGADGNLGIRGGSTSPVNVVVNNFGSEKATTKKSVDSRGQTQIEVTIGNMVASQLNSTGSQIQQTMHTTYGQEPTLPRR
jgi:Lambda phage tail tape-measure protein (Tape_meas_lam_C)